MIAQVALKVFPLGDRGALYGLADPLPGKALDKLPDAFQMFQVLFQVRCQNVPIWA